MTNFNEQTGELRVNDVLTTTFNKQTGEIKLTNSTSSQTERMYSEEEVKSAFKKGFYRWNEPIEISDEEIWNEAKNWALEELITSVDSFVDGAKWYREQLKQINDKTNG